MIDTETHLQFDDQTNTELRFSFRNWLESWCVCMSDATKREVWPTYLSTNARIEGLTAEVLTSKEFLKFVSKQHELGGWIMRFPNGSVKRTSQARFLIRGEIECFTAGVVSCSGYVKLHVRLANKKFALLSMELEPRFRVVR